ncbi:hypothetical protein [Glycomyces sp. YM15]|uniref:hypothetical protein n=1 Tax=Glycomyces sp. YM15 TaxID=2800446 RepID=UPI0019654A9A|nr:hypothetical protein [Glycomyces sp. YM15]
MYTYLVAFEGRNVATGTAQLMNSVTTVGVPVDSPERYKELVRAIRVDQANPDLEIVILNLQLLGDPAAEQMRLRVETFAARHTMPYTDALAKLVALGLKAADNANGEGSV